MSNSRNKKQYPSGAKGSNIDRGQDEAGLVDAEDAPLSATVVVLPNLAPLPFHDHPTSSKNSKPSNNDILLDMKDQVRRLQPPPPPPQQQHRILPLNAHMDDPPTPPVDALASNLQFFTNNNTNTKISPRRLVLRKPPNIAASRFLPTVKDQARSIITAPPAAPRAITHQPTKAGGPDYKDQVRTVRRSLQALASAEGVYVSSRNEEPSTLIAVVIETLDDSAVADDDYNTVEEQPQRFDEDQEPPVNGPPSTVRKHLVWAMIVLLIVAGVVVAVVVASNSSGTGGSSPSPLPPPTLTAVPTVSPTALIQETKLTASDAAVDDQFGRSVAIDRDTIVVGAFLDDNDNSGSDSGSAYVYMRTGTTWTEQAKLTASDGAANDRFGFIVDIAGDTIVVGAFADDDNRGSVYVYKRTGIAWTEQAKLMAVDGVAGDRFGISVAIDEDTIVVGSDSTGNGDGTGSTYVYIPSGTSWSQQAKLMASDAAAGDRFGRSVAIAGDAIIVGADVDDDNGQSSGSAYVFTRTGTTWTEQTKLLASDGEPEDRFGISVTIAADNIVVGAWRDVDNDTRSGSAYVYMRAGTTWTEQAKLTMSNGADGDQFGHSVAIAGDSFVVGAFGAENNGSVYVYMRTGTSWTEQAKLTASDGAANDQFGVAVAIDEGTIVVGSFLDNNDDNGDDTGSAYIYELNLL